MKSKNKNQSQIVSNRHFQRFESGSKKGKNLKNNEKKRVGEKKKMMQNS